MLDRSQYPKQGSLSKGSFKVIDEPEMIHQRHTGVMYSLKRDSIEGDNSGTNACNGCVFEDNDYACHHMKQIGFRLGCGSMNGIWKKADMFKKRKLKIK